MRKKLSKIILLLLISWMLIPISTWASLIDDLQAQINQKQTEIQQLEQQAAAYKKELSSAQNQSNTLKNQLALIESQIKKLQNDISITNTRISSTSLKIQELNLNIGEKQNEIDKKKIEISTMLQTLSEYDKASLMEIILTKNSLSDFVNQVHYVESLQETVHTDLSAVQQAKKEMENQKSAAETQRNQLASLNAQLLSQKQIVNQQKQDKSSLLTQTKGKEQQYQAMVNDVLKQQLLIEQQIYELEYKIKQATDPGSAPKARSGVLSWPIEGILTQGYGNTPYSKKLYSGGFHNGIDISTAYGEQIASAADGKIIAMGNCGKYAYGKWIAVEHNNGLTTLYGHLSNYGKFKTGDIVKTGDIIGFEGSTGYSTGAHLHFGVYLSSSFQTQTVWYGLLPLGAYLNPLDYL